MKSLFVPAVALSVVLSGCANIQASTGADAKTVSTVAGSIVGCAAGALLARATHGNALAGCTVGAVAGGLIGFEKARQEEIASAEQARREALAAMAQLPPAGRPVASEVKTVEITATDKDSHQAKKYRSFDSLSVDLPLSTRGTPEHQAALDKLKKLAERIADERGSSELYLAMTPADTKAQKVSLETIKAPTQKGTVTIFKTVDATLPKGFERVTVKAGKLKTLDV
ncbi:glycine zipper domain-containing protein [Variovorax saccharolyticus]|uniref:glycine zipper domain-containing protein n=1 Tax=Variovorax saccharolyticus TaxID=3053516 RepID=UPI002575E0E2|nr:hypothetical protein [Variovorax sp. J31P216]MDM0028405.1 hypothetical protein [Variovorax sp. J31P216]